MQTYFTSEPLIRTMSGGTNGMTNYSISSVTGMQEDTVLNGSHIYSGLAYCPDGHEDLDFMPMFRTMIDDQVSNLSTLQYWNSQSCEITQSTFAFNTYFSVLDSSGYVDDYSVVYDTRGITSYEAGAVNLHHTVPKGYPANLFPEKEIMQGQYFSLTYRNPSNTGEMTNNTFGIEYVYNDRAVDPSDPGYIVLSRNEIDTSVTGQSFRYSGPADWQDWGENHPVIRGRFFLYNQKGGYTYITPWLYPRWCDDPETVYFYWLNSLGGVEFLRGRLVETIEHEDSTYETGATIADYRDGFGTAIYSQRKWKSYTFNTKLISDNDSPNVADACGARFAWLYFPGKIQPWKTIKVNDAQATVKTYTNQGGKLYNYTFNLEDSVKARTV